MAACKPLIDPGGPESKYATAFEVEPRWLVDSASRRQKWIDQAQSLNLYINNASGKKLDVTYRMAWYSGLKTTYYLDHSLPRALRNPRWIPGNLNAVSSKLPKHLNQRQCLRPVRWTIQTVKPASKNTL
jgi:ribonucleoside-diphosphate reductase alpha chain